MARVTGPLFSMSATGTIGKALTFGSWKGLPWVRKWFTPENPNTILQQNVRLALSLVVIMWQSAVTAPQKEAYEIGSAGTGKSGYNLCMKRALDEYIIQLTSANTPVSVSVLGDFPSDVYTWL